MTKQALTSVTGFSLQTNSTLSGGFISASGISPICMQIRQRKKENK